MTLKKTFTLLFLILAICVVSVGCTYIVRHMLDVMNLSRQRYFAIPVVITGSVCIVAALINSIIETIQK